MGGGGGGEKSYSQQWMIHESEIGRVHVFSEIHITLKLTYIMIASCLVVSMETSWLL